MPDCFTAEDQLREPAAGRTMGNRESTELPCKRIYKGIDAIGVLNQVTQIISQQLNVNIHKLYIESTMVSSKEESSFSYTM